MDATKAHSSEIGRAQERLRTKFTLAQRRNSHRFQGPHNNKAGGRFQYSRLQCWSRLSVDTPMQYYTWLRWL